MITPAARLLPSAKDKAIPLLPLLTEGDILIDGENSYYVDDIRRAQGLGPKGILYLDVGTSGCVWGLERCYSRMIGGEKAVNPNLDSIFAGLAPGMDTSISRTPGRGGADYQDKFLSAFRLRFGLHLGKSATGGDRQ